jgi:hypothetical protein
MQIPVRSANIAGLLGWFRLTVLAMPCKPLQARLFESGLAALRIAGPRPPCSPLGVR